MNEAMSGVVEPVIAVINTSALRQALERRKRKINCYPRGKTNPDSLQIPAEWCKFQNGDPFIFHDSGAEDSGRFIILSSLFMLEKLVYGRTIAMDGTFKTRPRKWEQVFVIHVLINNRFVPAVSVIMAKRSRASYLSVLQQLREIMEGRFQVVWSPTLILTDFELAQRSAILNHFPVARHRCCYFHFAQAMQRWIQKVKLDQKYRTDVLFNEYIGLFRALAFMSSAICGGEIRQRNGLSWHCKTWIIKEDGTSPRFLIDIWNHSAEAMAGNPTTTCALQAWHRSINAATRERSHSMWKCLKLFKTEIGVISRNLCIQASSFSVPERSASKVQRQKQERLQQSIRTFSGTDLISGLQKITRTLRNLEGETGESQRQAAMAQEEMNNGGSIGNTRRRRSRNP
uniref:MULE transposase domain-containing protein n=1 Tax=Ditylenchus dipsaci TaxID=166011 RepID=A0A915EQS4_9BILA